MNILSYNPGHDGAIAYLKDARLRFSIEAEKNSHYATTRELNSPEQLIGGLGCPAKGTTGHQSRAASKITNT